MFDWLTRGASSALGVFRRAAGDDDEPARRPASEEKVRTLGARIPAFLPFLDPSQGIYETAEMRRAYRQMLAHPNIKSALFGKILSLCNTEINVKPPKRWRKVERYRVIADFCDWNLNHRLQEGIPGLAWDILSGALIDGYSINEKVWGLQDKGSWRGKRVLRRLKAKDPDSDVVLILDEFRNVVGVKGMRYNAGEVWHPQEFLIFTHMGLYENPTGMSDLRAAYGSYWLLDTVTKLRGMGAEKRYLPIVVGEYPEVGKQKSLEDALAAIKLRNWIAVPKDTKIQVMDLSGQSETFFSNFRRDLLEDIYLSIQYATLQALTGGQDVQRGSSAEHGDTATEAKRYLLKALLHALNDAEHGLIPDLCDTNFADVGDYPVAVTGGMSDEDAEVSLRVDQGLYGLGYPLDLEELEERYGRKIGQGENALVQQEQQPPGLGGGLDGLLGGGGNPKPSPFDQAGHDAGGQDDDDTPPKPPSQGFDEEFERKHKRNHGKFAKTRGASGKSSKTPSHEAACDHCGAKNDVHEGQPSAECRKCRKDFPLEWDEPPAKPAKPSKGSGAPAGGKRAAPGSQMPEAQRDKLRKLGMVGTFPPAEVSMSDVKVADLSRGKEALRYEPLMSWTQTTKSGRVSRQYRYTQEFHDRNAAEKFKRVMAVEPHLEKIGGVLAGDMANRKLPQQQREAAAIASIIRETGLRPTDGDDSVKHGHFGIASLQARHAKAVGDEVRLDFIGKEGVRNRTVVRDAANVAFLKDALSRASGKEFLFSEATSDHAGEALKEAAKKVGAPADVKLKDLRTVKATRTAWDVVKVFKGPPPPLSGDKKKDAKLIAGAILKMSGKVAEVLNNTPTQARDNYIHPEVFKSWQSRLGAR